MASYRLGIIGAGGISRAHVAAAQATNGAISIAAIVDPVEAARKATADAAGGCASFASFEELLNSDNPVDGIALCTPPSARIPIVRQGIERKIAVLSEKPLAHNVGDAKKLVEMAGKASSLTAVGYCHRFTPAMLEIKKRIASGQLGTLVRFENTFACDLSEKMKSHWMSDPKISGGGSFIDTGCHSLDLYRFLFGNAIVKGAVFTRAWPGRGESNATVLLRSESGVAGAIQSGWAEAMRFTVAVVGTAGTLSYDYMKEHDLVWTAADGKSETIHVESHAVRFQRQLEAFAAGNKAALASFEDGLKTNELVEQAQKVA